MCDSPQNKASHHGKVKRFLSAATTPATLSPPTPPRQHTHELGAKLTAPHPAVAGCVAAEYQYRVLFLNEDKTDDFSFAGRCCYELDSTLQGGLMKLSSTRSFSLLSTSCAALLAVQSASVSSNPHEVVCPGRAVWQ